MPHTVEAGLRAIHSAPRWVAPRAAAAAVLGVAVAWAAPAKPQPPARSPGTVVVDVRAANGAPAWLAAALNEHLARELATYVRLRIYHRDDSASDDCGPDPACRVRRYGRLGVDVVFVANADATALRYALYETWTPSQVAEGAIALQGAGGLLGLRQRLLKAFAPVLTPGGLLDQKPYRTRIGRAEPSTAIPAPDPAAIVTTVQPTGAEAKVRDLAALLAAAAVFFFIPLIAARRLAATGQPLHATRWPSTWLSTSALIGALALVAAREAELIPPVVPLSFGALEDRHWAVGLLGGAAWGAFLISNVGLLFPALPGLDRVAHRDVFRLIRAWLFVCATRIVTLAAYYLPFALAISVATDGRTWSASTRFIVMVPAVGLGARLWLSSWTRALAVYLDRALVVGSASPDNPWHPEISRYFAGYLRRTGWALEPERLDAIIFLPGRREGLHCYGGGTTPARVVIDERVLGLAIGALNDRRVDEDVAPADWSEGVLGPSSFGRTRIRNARRAVSANRIPLFRREPLTSATGHHRKQLGQAATLLGYVRPEPGERVPLIADTIEDLEVVRALLSEHYQWFAPDPDDDHDDTDPTDKDFLFGGLAYAVGQIVRRDSQLQTFTLAVDMAAARTGRWSHAVYRAVRAGASAAVGRAPVIIADAFAALHYGRHHHLQYLWYRATGREDPLTVRAGIDELESTSSAILKDVRARLDDDVPPPRDRASFFKRVVWLSRFFLEPLVDRYERRARWLRTAAVTLVVLSALGLSVHRAVQYHPIYVERLAQQARGHRPDRRDDVPPAEGSSSHDRKQQSHD